MNDRDRIGEDLAQSRKDLAEAIAALGQGFDIARFFGGRAGRSADRSAPDGAGPGPVEAAVMPALRAAGEAANTAIRANPGAAALAGVGLAWLAWSGFRRRAPQPREARPEWLIAIAALREDAARLRARIERSRSSGALDDEAARDSLEDVAASLDLAIRQEIGRGLEGLDGETRTAALIAREAACRREFGKSAMPRQTAGRPASGNASGAGARSGRLGRLFAAGAVLTAAGGCLAAFLKRGQPGSDAAEAGWGEANPDMAGPRQALNEDLDQLTGLLARLTSTLRDVLEETAARAEDPGMDPGEMAAEAAERDAASERG